jgi:hypothetical protein
VLTGVAVPQIFVKLKHIEWSRYLSFSLAEPQDTE